MSKAAELAKMGEVLTNSQIGGRRNIVINGAMQVSQRSTSASSITSTGYHALDRFQLLYTDAGTWTMSQSSTTPNGFANSLKLDCTSAKSSLASDSRLFLQTKIEGQDVQQFKKGTSDAEQYTLSFHVRSNKTGTYQVNIEDNDNTRIVGSTYTISSADTWEKKEITFVADTTGAFADDTGDSLAIMWALVAGTDNSSGAVPTAWEAKVNTDRGAGLNINLADSTDNEWYITGVQLEVGSTATPFEHRSPAEELRLCQRYFEVSGTGSDNPAGYNFKSMFVGVCHNTGYIPGQQFSVEKRADATVVIFSRNGTSGKVSSFNTGSDEGNNHAINAGGVTGFHAVQRDGGTYTTGQGYEYGYTAEAEL
tara:strand:+ start:174 stop:1271 length:1098 start_codon:yes stop_codon:yes gene_type:complete